MKHITKKRSAILSVQALLVLLVLSTVLTLASCTVKPTETATETATKAESLTETSTKAESATVREIAREGVWADATYVSDKSFGTGKTTVSVDVVADGQSVTFTLHTDAETLGAALVAERLIEGEESQYGLYIKKVNGILADYDVDGYWWSISKDGVMLSVGADFEKITADAHYAFTRTK